MAVDLIGPFRLDGKVAIVTGASYGLGVLFAEILATAGADVVVTARSVDKLQETKALIESLGRRCLAVAGDVTEYADCERVVTATMAEFGRIDKQIKSTVDAIADGMYHPSMKAKMEGLEARKAQLEAELAHAEEPPPLLHPKMAGFYREQVKGLAAALRGDEGGSRTEAAERLRSLVRKIVLTPADGKLTIDVHGDLAGILTIAQTNALSKKVDDGTDAGDQLRLPQNNKGRPREGAAFVAELAKQVKLVAGARNRVSPNFADPLILMTFGEVEDAHQFTA